MKNIPLLLGLVCALVSSGVPAQVAVQANPNQEPILASADARLAANKRLVYDFWREVFEGAHMEFADKYMAESYIQHNPNVPTGAPPSSSSSPGSGSPRRSRRASRRRSSPSSPRATTSC